VVLGDVLQEQGRKVAEEIVQQGENAAFVRLDVTVEADWQRAVETAERTYGKLQILVNNAGIVRMGSLDETSLDTWHEVINVNQTGVFLGMKHAIPAMRRAAGGSIINISSIAGLIGLSNLPAYQASKDLFGSSLKTRRFNARRTISA
jgi:NAD(P)-dependent dehydrogenase (short-subunit alcohol dehydrogenase family)